MNLTTTTALIAATLNANEAPIELVLDMADTLEDTGDLMKGQQRALFVRESTRKLSAATARIGDQIFAGTVWRETITLKS